MCVRSQYQYESYSLVTDRAHRETLGVRAEVKNTWLCDGEVYEDA